MQGSDENFLAASARIGERLCLPFGVPRNFPQFLDHLRSHESSSCSVAIAVNGPNSRMRVRGKNEAAGAALYGHLPIQMHDLVGVSESVLTAISCVEVAEA